VKSITERGGCLSAWLVGVAACQSEGDGGVCHSKVRFFVTLLHCYTNISKYLYGISKKSFFPLKNFFIFVALDLGSLKNECNSVTV
jgi:hypothetical protein